MVYMSRCHNAINMSWQRRCHVGPVAMVCTALIKVCSHRAPIQYPIRGFIVRSHKALKPPDWYLELSGRSEIWQASQQHCQPRYLSNIKVMRWFKLPILRMKRWSLYWNGNQVENSSVICCWPTQIINIPLCNWSFQADQGHSCYTLTRA